MHPKSAIQSLNLRREINRRLLFLKRRMAESIVEHHFMHGKISALPEGMKIPPEWALNSARLAWETGLGSPFKDMNPEGIRKDPRGSVKQMIGLYESMLSFVANPMPQENAPEVRDAVDKLRRYSSQIVARKFLTHLKNLEKHLDRLLPPPTPEQLLNIGGRYIEGLHAGQVNLKVLRYRFDRERFIVTGAEQVPENP